MTSPKILGLRTTIYKVGDLEKAKDWYSIVFGTAPYFDEPYYVGFNIGGYELGLQPEKSLRVNTAESVVAYWGIEDIDSAFNFFISSGAVEHEKPFNVGGEIMTATVRDPWGNIIGLIYNPEFRGLS